MDKQGDINKQVCEIVPIPEHFRLKIAGVAEVGDKIWNHRAEKWVDFLLAALVLPDVHLKMEISELHPAVIVIEFAPGELTCEEFSLIAIACTVALFHSAFWWFSHIPLCVSIIVLTFVGKLQWVGHEIDEKILKKKVNKLISRIVTKN